MYKILIVDDEKLIRKGIIAKLKHHNINFSWIGEAANGREALTIIESECIDIAITDVRMPVMDGIELIRHCYENSLKVRFIILSGYAEFAYAEQALNMGVSAYILKPIDDNNLVKTIKKVMKDIMNSRKAEENARNVAVLGKDRDRLLQERVLNQIFHTSRNFYKDTMFKQIGLNCKDNRNYYILAMFHVDSDSYYHSPFKFEDLVLIKFSIKNILEEIEYKCYKIIVDNQKDVNQIFILFYDIDKYKLKTSSYNYIRNAYSKIQLCLNISITIGVSNIQGKLTNKLYKQSKMAFEQRLILGNNQILFFEKVVGNSKLILPDQKIKLLQKCMDISDFNGIRSILNDIFLCEEASDMAGIYIRLVYFRVVNSLLKLCNNYGINNINDSDFLSGEVIDYMENPQQIVEYLYMMIKDILTDRSTDNGDCKELIDEIEAYILNNYNSEITVLDLAKRYSINPDYLSAIFKHKTGKNIIKYLTEIRIKMACQLLRETQAKVSDIAFSSGYKDRQYFNRVFKKITGMTPIEYRNMKDGLS